MVVTVRRLSLSLILAALFIMPTALFAANLASPSYILKTGGMEAGNQKIQNATYINNDVAIDPFLGPDMLTSSGMRLYSGNYFISRIQGLSDVASPVGGNQLFTVLSGGNFGDKAYLSATINGQSHSRMAVSLTPSIGEWPFSWDTTTQIYKTAEYPGTANVLLFAEVSDYFFFSDPIQVASLIVDNEAPAVPYLSVAPAIFSPRFMDGVNDVCTIYVTIADSSTGNWAIKITDGPTTLRTFSGTGFNSAISVVFDGKDDAGIPLLDGNYFCFLSGVDAAGNTFSKLVAYIVIDNVQPSFEGSVVAEALITPGNSQTGGIQVSFSGTDNVGLSTPTFYRILHAQNGVTLESPIFTEWFPTFDAASNTWREVGNGILDSATYEILVYLRDQAGNQKKAYSNYVTTLDRTPPQIRNGSGQPLTQITMTEDVVATFNLDAYFSDNLSAASSAQWFVYDTKLGPYAHNVLLAATIPNVPDGPVTNTLVLTPSPNTNTAANTGGNQFGYPGEQIFLKLVDAAGNSTSGTVALNITPVNDLPTIQGTIGQGVLTDGQGQVVYNLKLAEGQGFTGITLDSFLADVDNLLSDLTISATRNVTPTQPIPVTLNVQGPAGGHRMTLTPEAHWYGTDTSVIQISDGGVPVTTSFTTRITPVNETPLISALLPTSYIVDEDTVLDINLFPYENDELYEDRVPTYHSQLNWTAAFTPPEDGTVLVQSLTGENSLLDLIQITPKENKYGTAVLKLTLTDTDRVEPQKIFPDYTPNPKSVTTSVTVGWRPVNDTPVITLDHTPIILSEDDVVPVVIDYNQAATDAEDSFDSLQWSVTTNRSDLLTITHDSADRKISILPKPNAWGAATLYVSVTDVDTGSGYPGYTPNPKTATAAISVSVRAVNDTPSISGAAITASSGTIVGSSRLKSSETLFGNGTGYTDVGYVNGVRNELAVGDEYGPSSNVSLAFVQNDKRFRYAWFLDGVLVGSVAESSIPTADFSITSATHAGKTMRLDAAPNDTVAIGVTRSVEVIINTPPTAVSLPAMPANDIWVSVNRMALAWNAATDVDADAIAYRVKVLKTAITAATPSILVDDTGAYYDSGWVDDPAFLFVPDTTVTYSDGTYYWAVFSGNKCTDGSYDALAATAFKKFNVDTVRPANPSADYIVTLPDLDGGTNGETEQFQILYGERETFTAVWLESYNERRVTVNNVVTLVTSSNYAEIVAVANSPTWSYQLIFPPGSSTFNVWVLDRAGNRNILAASIYVKEDYTPPISPIVLGMQLVNGIYTAISSSNVYTISGIKETESAVWFGDAFAAGFDGATFNIEVVPDHPTANLVAIDRAGNISQSVPISITFLVGDPSLGFAQSRTVVNRVTDVALNQTTIDWQSDRSVLSWSILASGNATIASGNAVAAAVTQSVTILATALQNGENALTLNVTDLAGNVAKRPFAVTVQVDKPTIEVVNANYFLSGGNWHISLVGKMKAGESVYINNSREFVSENVRQGENLLWIFRNFDSRGIRQTLDLSKTDVTIRVVDQVANESTLKYYEAARDYLSIQSVANTILVPYTSLPENILKLQAIPVAQARLNGPLTIQSTVQTALGVGASKGLLISENLKASQYVIYGQRLSGESVPTGDLKQHRIVANIPVSISATTETSRLAALRFDPDTKTWIVPSVNQTYNAETRTMQVELDRLGIWGLGELKPAGTSISDVRIYPNPWRPNDGIEDNGTAETGITIDQLPANAKLRVYAMDGRLIRSVTPTDTSWNWDGKNESGEDVASGVYLIAVDANGTRRISKLTILR